MQLFLKILSGMTNNINPDQPAPSGAILSGSTLFAYAILSETLVYKILGHLPYIYQTHVDVQFVFPVIQIYNHSGYSLYKVSEVITLSCSLTTNSNFNSSFYLIHYGNQQRLEPSYSDGNLSVFEIKSAALEDDGQYNCYYGNCNKPSFNSMIHIAVVGRYC